MFGSFGCVHWGSPADDGPAQSNLFATGVKNVRRSFANRYELVVLLFNTVVLRLSVVFDSCSHFSKDEKKTAVLENRRRAGPKLVIRKTNAETQLKWFALQIILFSGQAPSLITSSHQLPCGQTTATDYSTLSQQLTKITVPSVLQRIANVSIRIS